MSGTCATTHALVSGLLGRVRREAWVPAAGDLRPLLELGVDPSELSAAFASIGTDAAAAAERVLADLAWAPEVPRAPTSSAR